MKKHFKLIVKTALISVYVIFLAGSIVRMTGSGMGCPDWPKCFGYYIPPTDEAQLRWKANTAYNEGTLIVLDETLYVANSDLQTELEWKPTNWSPYTKHEYAIFNVYHTWTEYINRLASVVSGLIFLFLIAASLKFWKEKKGITLLSFGAFFMMLFEAWLGKTVVDSVLEPWIITVHMLVGLLIIAVLLQILAWMSSEEKRAIKFDKTFHKLLLLSTLFSVIQIAMGTQVRQFVDEQVRLFGFESKQMSSVQPQPQFLHPPFVYHCHCIGQLLDLLQK